MIKLTNLVIFFFLLSLTGCGEGTYVAEKKYFHANIMFYDLRGKDADGSLTNDDIDRVILLFREITMKYPFWERSAEAHLKIGKLLERRKKYDAAIKEYMLIPKNFSKNRELAALALKSAATIYEVRHDWQSAEQIYERIIREYPYTAIGLVVPIYLGKKYAKMNLFDKSEQSYHKAIKFYKSIIEKDVKEDTILRLIDFVLTCCLDLGQNQQALDFLQELEKKDPDSIVAARCLFKTAEIYDLKLNEQTLARQYYQELIERFPKLKISKKVKEKIIR